MYSKGGGTECNFAFDFHLLLVYGRAEWCGCQTIQLHVLFVLTITY